MSYSGCLTKKRLGDRAMTVTELSFTERVLLALVSVLSQSLLTLVR